MAKEDVVAAGVLAVQAAEEQALKDQLGIAYDAGALDQKAADGTLSQADLDAAVAQAVAAVQSVDAQALAEAQANAQGDLSLVQSALDAMTAKEQLEEKVVSDLNDAIQAVQASFDAIKALFPKP